LEAEIERCDDGENVIMENVREFRNWKGIV